MKIDTCPNSIRFFEVKNFLHGTAQAVLMLLLLCGATAILHSTATAQSPVSGGFEGRVTDSATGAPIPGATVQFINLANGFQTAKKSDANGYFVQTDLPPGNYIIRVLPVAGFKPAADIPQSLFATRSNSIVPVPITLVKETVADANNPTPSVTPVPPNAPNTGQIASESDTDKTLIFNPRRDGAFDERAVRTLPLGGTTLTRTFDELAFLVPGVAPPPQAIGNSVGPGVGGGVGTSGQFAVNGLRSRANNFTVDGSDNNDEDIGVRRQGFFSLVPQPIESIQEFQIITLLAPAQYGRNLGAQVNALSKSGGNRFSGTLYGFFNSSALNARNFFDGAGGNKTINLNANRTSGTDVPVIVDGTQGRVTNFAGDKDSSTLLQGGFAVGGRIVRNKMFFFASGEGQLLNATQERNFAVPTVEQRGLFGTGSRGLQQCLGPGPLGADIISGVCTNLNNNQPINFTPGFPTSVDGDAVFSLFPFANNPNGVYGANTYTQALSADARGVILSGRFDYNFKRFGGRAQTFTARYNFTDDQRDLTDVGGALFSSIRPLVQTNNLSMFLSGGLTDKISNEFRFSFGRTKLEFEELRDTTGFIVPLSNRFNNPRDARFLLNARLIENFTLPNCNTTGCTAPTVADYRTRIGNVPFGTTAANSNLGPIGQLIIAGFSPVGVDVFNFPQERNNNTFQFADTVRWQIGRHSLAFGADIRRTLLNSDLPRNSRPLVTFNGSPDIVNGGLESPLDLAAAGAATGFFQSLALPGNDSRIKLSYNQLDFFIQDEWRARPNLVVSFGLRYEFNSSPKEADRKIENTFQLQADRSLFPILPIFGLDTFRGYQDFLDGRRNIFNSDKNNFAPRFGIAWSPTSNTVIRGGAGIFYDQILGAVVSQSRNVLPTFYTLNTGGGENCPNVFGQSGLGLLNPITGRYSPTSCSNTATDRLPLVQPGTLNTLNPNFPNRMLLLQALLGEFPRSNGTSFGATIPTRVLETPVSYQYSVGVEQKLFGNTFLSVAYVGTLGRNLLRFTTPNLGSNYIGIINRFDLNGNQPIVTGTTIDPFSNPADLSRPNRNIGPVNQFETTGRSLYNSLQIEVRGRFQRNLQYQFSYVYGSVNDDVSDVFDLAGASALPQNSLTQAGEYAPANFDVRHRFTYNFVYDLPGLKNQNGFVKYLLGGWQVAGTGKFNTGQPFTVNSIFDINLDGNLTDRLDNTRFITQTNDRRQPLRFTGTPANLQSMLAALGDDGRVPRNSFRAGSILDLDLSFIKRFAVTETQNLQFRVDIFNFINRANFGIPVRFLESPGFGQATNTVTPGRRIQFALKYTF